MTDVSFTNNTVMRFAKMAAEFSRDALLVTDENDRVLWLNRGFTEMTGYTLEDLVGKNPDKILRGPDTGHDAVELIYEGLRRRQACDIEILYYRKDGKKFWMETRITPVFDDNGKHTNFMSSSRDITARLDLQHRNEVIMHDEAKRQKERKVLSQVSEWLYSAKSLEELLLVVSRSLEILMPEAAGQLFVYSNSRDVLENLVSWGNQDEVKHIDADDCWALRRGRAYSYGAKAIEFPCHHVNGTKAPYFCLPITAHGQTNGLLHLKFDMDGVDCETAKIQSAFLEHRWELALLCAEQISLAIANVQLRQELLDQSIRDPLTNLWNRRWFLEAAHRAFKKSNQSDDPIAIISLDVDHFKKFNDHHGHDAGDIVLRAIGNAMHDFFGPDADPCRMGGEEFVVLCVGMTSDQAYQLAQTFRKKVASLDVKYAGNSLPTITMSIGIASFPDDGKQIVDVLKQADDAMYKAKTNGRNQVVLYSAKPNLDSFQPTGAGAITLLPSVERS